MKLLSLIASSLLALAAPAGAGQGSVPDPGPSAPRWAASSLMNDAEISVHWGTFGALDTEQLFEVGAELRFARQSLWNEHLSVRPILGTSILDDGGNYSYLGLRGEVALGAHHDWSLGLSFAPGVYSAGGVDLGGPLEFKSGLDVGYEFSPGWRASVGLYHLSNGGLYSQNGGSESVLFALSRSL